MARASAGRGSAECSTSTIGRPPDRRRWFPGHTGAGRGQIASRLCKPACHRRRRSARTGRRGIAGPRCTRNRQRAWPRRAGRSRRTLPVSSGLRRRAHPVRSMALPLRRSRMRRRRERKGRAIACGRASGFGEMGECDRGVPCERAWRFESMIARATNGDPSKCRQLPPRASAGDCPFSSCVVLSDRAR